MQGLVSGEPAGTNIACASCILREPQFIEFDRLPARTCWIANRMTRSSRAQPLVLNSAPTVLPESGGRDRFPARSRLGSCSSACRTSLRVPGPAGQTEFSGIKSNLWSHVLLHEPSRRRSQHAPTDDTVRANVQFSRSIFSHNSSVRLHIWRIQPEDAFPDLHFLRIVYVADV
jgi:hypothetical protein